jgi:hypothetical protein
MSHVALDVWSDRRPRRVKRVDNRKILPGTEPHEVVISPKLRVDLAGP